MKDIELKNKITIFLEHQYNTHKTFPQEFTAKETADAVNGVPTRIGVVAEAVVKELRARGVNIAYVKNGNPRKFVIKEPQ
jgi:hypothetical protein